MAELLLDRLGISTGLANRDDKQATRSKRRQVTNILEWIQCFGIYVAVLTLKHPDRIQDLLGYQALIVEACMEYNCEAWLGYDRRFRQDAAASSNTVWAKIDPTLWNKAFTGQARAQRCQYCFSLTHKSEDCDWADAPSTSRAPKLMPSSMPTKPTPTPCTAKICYAWNHSPEAACPSVIALTSISAYIVRTTTRSFTKTTRHYTAGAGGAMAPEATGNLLLPPPTDHNREPPTATSPT